MQARVHPDGAEEMRLPCTAARSASSGPRLLRLVPCDLPFMWDFAGLPSQRDFAGLRAGCDAAFVRIALARGPLFVLWSPQ
jgi:hypothetical protein